MSLFLSPTRGSFPVPPPKDLAVVKSQSDPKSSDLALCPIETPIPGALSVKLILSHLIPKFSIGRITEGLLLSIAEEVDVVEPIAKFTEGLSKKTGIRQVFNVGLEEWQPSEGVKYGLIWNQWCVGHLTDEQLVRYLERCKTVLTPDDGLIVVKENTSTSGVDLFDDEDSSVTR